MKKKLVVFISLLTLGAFSIGAATGSKITAELRSQSIVSNGYTTTKQVVSYGGTTYVPLREFGDLTGISINYSNGKIYVGGNNTVDTPVKSSAKKFTFVINGVTTGSNYEDRQVAIVDINMLNNSGESTTPSGSLYDIKAYQNGVELEKTFDSELTHQDEYTSVMTGTTVNFKNLYILKDNSAVTIEIKELFGNDKISKTFNL